MRSIFQYVPAEMLVNPALIQQVVCFSCQLVEVLWHICLLGTILEESTRPVPTLSRPETRDGDFGGSDMGLVRMNRDNTRIDSFRGKSSLSGRSDCLGDDEQDSVARLVPKPECP